jgi:TATA-binding protein-associated factor Taf7
MSGLRILKIRRSTPPEAPEVPEAPPAPVVPTITFRPPQRVEPVGPVPMEPPYDRQCIMRFPEDVAEIISEILESNGTTELTEIVRIAPEDTPVNGHDYRLYSISVFEDQRHLKKFDMKGVLVDLPTFVESYKTVNNGVTVTKSADISQMMICFKKNEFSLTQPSHEVQKALNLLYPSGLTPPTHRIRYRKFRPPPSKEEVQNLRSAEDLVESVMSGGALEWVVQTEVDEEEAVQRSINEPENVWTPTEEILQKLREAGYIDANGDLIQTDEDEDMIEGLAALGE